jgi:hypothetical protein
MFLKFLRLAQTAAILLEECGFPLLLNKLGAGRH